MNEDTSKAKRVYRTLTPSDREEIMIGLRGGEIKRRTKVATIFPNKDSLNRLVSALLMEIDETWATGKRYLDMETE